MTDDAAQRALEELAALLEPLVFAAEDEAHRRAILAELGWRWDGLGSAGARIGTALEAAAGLRDVVVNAAAAANDGFDTLADALTALEAVTETVTAMQALARAFDGAAVPAPETFAALPGELLELLTMRHLQRAHPTTLAVLEVLTLADPATAAEPTPLVVGQDGRVVRREQQRARLRLDRLPRLLTQPQALLKEVYLVPAHGLTTVAEAAAVADALFPRLQRLALAFGVPAAYGVNPALGLELGEAGGEILPRTLAFWATVPFEGLETTFGAALALASQERGGIGLVVAPFGELALTVDLGGWRIVLEAGGNLGGIAIGADGVMFAPDGAPTLDLGLQVQKLAGADGGTALLIGGATGTRLEIGRFGIRTGGHFEADRQDYGFDVEIGAASLVIAAGEGDGFLQQVLPREGLRVDFDFGLGWSRAKGVHFAGSGGLEASFPVAAGLPFGLARIDAVHLALRAAQDAVTTQVAITATLTLGPFTAAIDRVGLAARLRFPDGGGNLGPVDLDLRFKPPSGIGLAIKTPAVSGGGFLEFDYDAGRYSGVFELTILDMVSVKVIGLITTKLPGDRPGFALILVITAQGFTPVQLGMGFALTGVGGLLALNRTIDVDVVRGGLRDGVLDSVLFVEEPVKNAARVIATLDRVFPLAPDRLLIGPLAEIAWGSPPVVKIRLALLLEIPHPVSAVLLAALRIALPDEDDPVVELQVDAVGVLDFARGELALDASLHHSRLWKFALTGDMALRLNWGDDPQFLLSVGGFHPRFTPPSGLRQLERLTFALTDGENPRIRLESYLAITSNTIQMGARVSLYAELAGFGIDGGGAFDALVRWVPFGIDVSFSAWVRVFTPAGNLLAVSVAVDLTGPRPWHVVGVASVQFLGFTVRAGVDFTLGEAAEPPVLETVDVAALLWEELSHPANWQAALGPAVSPGVTLSIATAGSEAPLVAHPLAAVGARQKVAPLATRITRMGALRPKDGARRYDLDAEVPAGVRVGALTGLFAPAQFVELADDEKLTAPSFAELPAGIALAPESAVSAPLDRVPAADLAFETLELTSFDVPAAHVEVSPAPAFDDLLDEEPAPRAPASAGWEVVPR